MAERPAGRDNDIGIAILGYGVVGKGVANAIRCNGGLMKAKTGVRPRLLRVLDLLDFPDSPDATLITHNVDDVMDDPAVDIVVETMGGIRAANEFTKKALARRKHVVTSNKELVAEYGPELLALASQNGVSYAFEASVGGAIPIVTPLMESLAPNGVAEITGILNGTTNYMLTYMKEHGAGFEDALRDAQSKGFAEQRPSADVDGLDACRKLAILASVAWGGFLDWNDIYTEGVAGVTRADIENAEDLGRSLKLIARAARLNDGKVEARVTPAMIDRRSPVNCADGVNNAILVRGDLAGDVMFYGQGAGMTPTSSAIAADILHIATGKYENPRWDREGALAAADIKNCVSGFYIRLDAEVADAAGTKISDAAGLSDAAGASGALTTAFFREFPDARLLPSAAGDRAAGSRPLAFTVSPTPEGTFFAKLNKTLASVPGSKAGFVARLL